MIEFTQYLRPNGEKRKCFIERSSQIEEKADKIIAKGYVFECEELRTGHVSFTIFDPSKQENVAILVCVNGPNVPTTVDQLISDFDLSNQV